MYYIWGYIVIILIASVLMTIQQQTNQGSFRVEHFTNDGIELTTKPLEVYFTNDLDRCDFPGSKTFSSDPTISNTEVDYNYDVKWYEKMYEYLKAYYGITYDDNSPTPEQNATLMELQSIIDNYKGHPGQHKTNCKVKVPNWVTFMPTTETILLGNIKNNATRGKPNSWAYIGHPQPNVNYLLPNGIDFVLDENKDDYYKIKLPDGTVYTRGAITEFSDKMITALYCDTVRQFNDFVIYFGLKIDPETNIVKFIKKNTEVDINNISDYDIVTFFAPFFSIENVTQRGKKEVVTKAAVKKPYRVTRIMKTLCGVLQKQLTNIEVTVMFEGTSEIKSIISNLTDSKYYAGGTDVIADTKRRLDAELNKLSREIGNLQIAYNDAVKEYDKLSTEINNLDKKINDEQLKINVSKRLKSRWWYSNWNTSMRDRVDVQEKSLQEKYDKLVQEKDTLSVTHKTKNGQVQISKDTLDDKNLEYSSLKRLRDNVDEYSKFMNEQLIRDIRNMLVNEKLRVDTSEQPVYISKKNPQKRVELPGLYWRHLSYDGNLYIVL